MKLILALCVLSVAVTCLEAAPQRLEWETLVPARRTEQRLKGFGEIWSNCSKCVAMPLPYSSASSRDSPGRGGISGSATTYLAPPLPSAGKSTDPAKIISVKISPDPPVKGKDVTVTAEFELGKAVTG